MPLKRHHKIIIGSFSSLVIIFMILTSIFVYTLFMKQQIDYNNLHDKISRVEEDTQNKINVLAESLIQTQELAEESQQALQLEMNLLKASAGEDFSGIIEEAVKSVVIIRTDSGQGTGFIISSDGYIVTNYHIIEDETDVQVITYEEETIDTTVVGYNQNFDIVLLKIPGRYEELKLADSNDIQIGEKVIAIGNPYGLEFSVTSGIVSAVHREGINGVEAYVQVDAPLNPGNSGGPLINTDGKVIGINNFKVGEAESLGFALESNYIEGVVNGISQLALMRDLL
jgi:S1-C subfamily serine protease